MRRIIRKIIDFLEIHLPVFIILVLIFSVVIQVFARYLLNLPLPRVFEISIYSFVWAIYLGGALAKRYRMHMRFNIIYRKLPRKAQLISDIIFEIITSVILVIILVPSVQYTLCNYKIKSSALRIPWTYLLLCFPIFISLVLIHNVFWIYVYIQELKGNKIPLKEETLPWE